MRKGLADLATALGIVEKAQQVLDRAGCNRIYSSMKLDIRKGSGGRLKGKLESVREKIGDVTT